jgi:hypothetical protein
MFSHANAHNYAILSIDPPPGRIRRDRSAGPDTFDQRLIRRLKPCPGRRCSNDPAGGHPEPEASQRLYSLPREVSRLLVQLGRQRDRPRTEPAFRRPQRVRGLRRVTAVMPPPTVPTFAVCTAIRRRTVRGSGCSS